MWYSEIFHRNLPRLSINLWYRSVFTKFIDWGIQVYLTVLLWIDWNKTIYSPNKRPQNYYSYFMLARYSFLFGQERCLLDSNPYFDLTVKQCGSYQSFRSKLMFINKSLPLISVTPQNIDLNSRVSAVRR